MGREHVSSNILNEKQKTQFNLWIFPLVRNNLAKMFSKAVIHTLAIQSSFSHQIKPSFLHVFNIKTLRIRGVIIIMSVVTPAGIIDPCNDVFLYLYVCVCVCVCVCVFVQGQKERETTYFPKTGSKVQGM